ncbi:MAG: hypothetical protein IJY74_00120 [Oscillospiraceae bacterium]|nr:hypothetical protein [Oscillospiraceae bacterium]
MMQTEIRSGSFTDEEIKNCILHTKKRWGVRLPKDLRLILERDPDGNIVVTYDPPIERCVYRSTDYLVNNMEKLNSAKQAEHNDKCMHV